CRTRRGCAACGGDGRRPSLRAAPRSRVAVAVSHWSVGSCHNPAPCRRPIDAVRTVQYSDKKAQSKRWSGTRAKRGSGYGGGTNRNGGAFRSEEHTSELQSRENLVCRLLLEKKKTKTIHMNIERTQ